MKTTQHTPSPRHYRSIFTDKDGLIAALSGRYKSYRTKAEIDPETLANARLIASAPDLLEALQVIADGGCFDQGPNCLGFVNMSREQMMVYAHSVWFDAREAIAKAKHTTKQKNQNHETAR